MSVTAAMREVCRHAHGKLIAILLLMGLVGTARSTHGGRIRCCVMASGSCRSTCEKMSLVSMATDQKELELNLQKLSDLCHYSYMINFWSCMNETLDEIDKGKGWIGRPCCRIPQSEKCKMACLQAQTTFDLASSCRKSDENPFFSCIERYEAGERCCKNATSTQCAEACKRVFASSHTPPKEVRDAIHKHCTEKNSGIQQCVQVYIHVTPADNPYKNMRCCEKSPSIQCRTACKETLMSEATNQEIVDGLQRGGCGPPLPQDRLWQCFLINSVANEPGGSLTQSEKVGMDSAKLQCCFRAATIHCQRLCIDTFSNQWTSSWSDFDRLCQYQMTESEMIRCLIEVDEPCELGCEGLSYCKDFNFRPTELFRSCDPSSDRAAQQDLELWAEGGVIPLPMMEIPVLPITKCHPDVWKAIACTLQIKPCHPEGHVNRICKLDCINILTKCIDPSHNLNPAAVCDILSPPGNDTPCISLEHYLEESKNIEIAIEVTHPCKPNPCDANDICMVDRNCLIGQPCRPYTCIKGCRMGDMSQLVVPRNSHVRLPSNTHPSNTHGLQCHMVCYCSLENGLEDCRTQPCLGTDPCWVDGKIYSHNSIFKVGCKTCYCYDSEVTCSPKQCWSGLPCNCQDHYVPVCGANGKTYPSACLARCVGLTDDQFEFGACYDSDPCSPNSCHPYHRCVPKKRVCVSIRHRSCKQYDCVDMQYNCNQLPKSPVCDTDNVEHPSICWMLQRRKALAYYGKCMPHCRARGLVCGHNGETYSSECAAWAERVSVDYKGACAAVGSKYNKNYPCGGIKCAPLPSEHCPKVFPPGSCCPICGVALRVLYSQKLSDWAVDSIRDVDPVVIQTIAEKLREHVKVTECELFAYLSLESDIVVLVIAIADSPTKLQVEACVREAQKLKELIHQHSPTLLTELPLSFFTTATMIDPVSDGALQLIPFYGSLLLAVVVIILQSLRTLS
ncbi:reversion-inducing cysteine-rich protein with Kazal motifs-like isoform X2 [Uloborus diversus]|uniref:reversion-inducing cysteine-rich protein with Kazal motifs-like isoform X2 n=1 Tax=Uloborus diversus TaxID=327109 RepID=UPI002408F39D|nr:reversion-inducing cysteine-rich protein with Kazal motifs-like isoform X2 [Uloborus diversus]